MLIGPERSSRYYRAMQGMIIRDEAGRLVPMRFTDSQEIMWRFTAPRLDGTIDPIYNPNGEKRLWFIVLKARQVYATTYFQNLTFLRTLEYPATNSLIIAQDLHSAGEIFDKAKMFYEHLPLPKMKPPKIKELVFPLPGGSSHFAVVSAGKASKGRGTTQSCVHCSEVAFWPHPEVLLGLFQAMPGHVDDTIWVLESTANGMTGQGEMFYEAWKDAVDGNSKLQPIFIPWFVMPKYREAPAVPEDDWDEEERLLVETYGPDFGLDGFSLRWRRLTIATKTQGMVDLFHQEYPSSPEEAFISSGLPAFDALSILKQQNNIRPPKIRGTMTEGKVVRLPGGEIRFWEEPQEGHQYVIGVDTAEGIALHTADNHIAGGDYACAQVLDMKTLNQAAVLHGPLPPWELALQINQLGHYYNRAVVCIEVNNTGHAVQDYLIRIYHYPRLHQWLGKPDSIQKGTPRVWGWETNVYSRPLLIEAGRRAINSGLITIRDRATLQEIKQFSKSDTGRYEAEVGHDDRVLALLLALRSREENYSEAARIYVNNLGVSEPDFQGIRVIDATDAKLMSLKHLSRVLRERAKEAVEDWMKL